MFLRLKNLLERWFGCKHKDFSFPQTQQIGKEKRCYVVCLKCGKEFGYDWKEMKVLVPNMSPGNGQKEGTKCH